ncbi:MAG: hypothetical protein LC745_12965, partial [Planctomycetia bacterium]|nr:hypothetical protein [Planctomycetia bacterium]
MAANFNVSAAGVKAALDAITALLGASATVKLYDGTQPAGPGTAVSTQVLIATLTYGATPFGAATAAVPAVATANAITSGTAVATSTVTWTRHATSGGVAVFDTSAAASGADLNFTPAAITTGQTVSISSLTLS